MADAGTVIGIIVIVGAISLAVAVCYGVYRCVKWCCGRIGTSLAGRPQRVDTANRRYAEMEAGQVRRKTTNRRYREVSDDVMMESTIEMFLLDMANERPIRFTADQLARFTRRHSTQLGRGGFGTVYKGTLPNNLPVAVKVLDCGLNLKTSKKQFKAEMASIGRTRHINLVKLYGFCFDGATHALVYEFMEHGSLGDYLSVTARGAGVSMAKVAKIAAGVARGLKYLHQESQPKILHLDIKPGNVLLDRNLTPKLGDFGLACLLKRDDTHVTVTDMAFTPGYAAPEVFQEQRRTDKCDVYSFGVLLLYIVCRGRNMEMQQWFPKSAWTRYEAGQLKELMVPTQGEEPRQCKELVEKMYKVAFWCVQKRPQARPSMSEVVKMLDDKKRIDPPPNPF